MPSNPWEEKPQRTGLYDGPVEVALVDAGEEPEAVQSVLQDITNITLTDPQAIIDVLPLILFESLPREEGEVVRARFAAVGASVEFRVPKEEHKGLTRPFPTD